jgi:hypothetical protein
MSTFRQCQVKEEKHIPVREAADEERNPMLATEPVLAAAVPI